VRWVAGWVDWSASGDLLGRAAVLLAAVAVGVVVYGLAAVVMRGEEVEAAMRLLRARLQGARTSRR